MSTIGYESWAVDLGEVGAIYPFQGWEVAMTVLGVIFWLGWHRIQYVRENAHIESARHISDEDKTRDIIDKY